MKLVIEIPEKYYELFKREDCLAEGYIANGTPLPKGHGRLIDADLLKHNMKFVCMGVMAGSDTFDEPLNEIDRAETIIEAYKDGEE